MVSDHSVARPKVLYIGGTGRTGSTLLGQVLGSIPGWFDAGELTFLWEFGLLQGGRCSCDEHLRDCPLWGPVLDALQASDPFDPAEMVRLRRRFRSVHLPIVASRKLRERSLDRITPYTDRVNRLYSELALATGAAVIVDASKEPHYSFILQQRADVDLYFLHLVREPRAILHSWQRTKPELGLEGRPPMERRGPLVAAAYYDVSNVASELIWRGPMPEQYRLLRYEDFANGPHRALREIGDFVGVPVEPETVLHDREFHPMEHHVAWGNPNRFRAGAVKVLVDDEWRRQPSGISGRLMGLLTAPVSRRYGYRRNGLVDPVARLVDAQIGCPS